MKQPKFKVAIITFVIAIIVSIVLALGAFFTFLNDASIEVNNNTISIYGYEYNYSDLDDFIDDYFDGELDNDTMMNSESQDHMMNENNSNCDPNGQLNNDYFEITSDVPLEYSTFDITSYSTQADFDKLIDQEITNALVDNNCNYITDDQIDYIEDTVESKLDTTYYNNNRNTNEDKDDFIERQFTNNYDLENYIEDVVRSY